MHEFIVQIAQKSGAAQAAPAALLPTALIHPTTVREKNGFYIPCNLCKENLDHIPSSLAHVAQSNQIMHTYCNDSVALLLHMYMYM